MSDQVGVGPELAGIGLIVAVIFVFGVIAEVGTAISDWKRRSRNRKPNV